MPRQLLNFSNLAHIRFKVVRDLERGTETSYTVWDEDENYLTESSTQADKLGEFLALAPELYQRLIEANTLIVGLRQGHTVRMSMERDIVDTLKKVEKIISAQTATKEA